VNSEKLRISIQGSMQTNELDLEENSADKVSSANLGEESGNAEIDRLAELETLISLLEQYRFICNSTKEFVAKNLPPEKRIKGLNELDERGKDVLDMIFAFSSLIAQKIGVKTDRFIPTLGEDEAEIISTNSNIYSSTQKHEVDTTSVSRGKIVDVASGDAFLNRNTTSGNVSVVGLKEFIKDINVFKDIQTKIKEKRLRKKQQSQAYRSASSVKHLSALDLSPDFLNVNMLSVMFKNLPRLSVTKVCGDRPLVTLFGPQQNSPLALSSYSQTSLGTNDEQVSFLCTDSAIPSLKFDEFPDNENMLLFREVVAGQTISTYPTISGDGQRSGDPICDHWAIRCFQNRIIVCLADGCGWGERSRQAAILAVDGFIEYMTKHQQEIADVKEIGTQLLGAFATAHKKLIEKEDEIGTTTLIGGVLLEIDKNNERWSPSWEFVCASVGDCKAFHVSSSSRPKPGKQRADPGMVDVMDITARNRPSTDPKDPGGRLGPYLEGGQADLRNLMIFCASCEPGDFLVLMSDGCHDNFDPECLGICPKDLPKWFQFSPSDTWKNIPSEKALKAKELYMLKLMEKKLHNVCTPADITNRILEHCLSTTEAGRKFMKSSGKKLPDDYEKFPGKMDHTSCVTLKVGKIPQQEAARISLSSYKQSSNFFINANNNNNNGNNVKDEENVNSSHTDVGNNADIRNVSRQRLASFPNSSKRDQIPRFPE